MFSNLADKLSEAFKRLRSKGKLTEADVKVGMREIKLALLEADVNFKVVKAFVNKVSERAVGAEVMESLLPGQQIVKIVNEELTALMGGSNSKLNISPKPPTVVLMCGLQGSGKTTHTAKLAKMYKKQGKNPLLVACDIYRPAAIKQLQVVAEQVGVPVFERGTQNPAATAKEAIKHKEDHPTLAKVFYDISLEEVNHIERLHGEVVRLIAEHRREHGEPPAAMMAVYEYLHEKHIDKLNKIKTYQMQFRA
jgi:signal recognition particle subunit SRP54